MWTRFLAGSLVVVSIVLIGFTGCGGGDAVVAHVGTDAINRSAVNRWIAVMAPGHVAPDKQQDRALKKQALDLLISSDWLIGEARDQRLQASKQEVENQLETKRALLNGGASVEDLRLKATADLAATAIRQRLSKSERPISHEQIASYYRSHLRRFETEELRTVDIAEGYKSLAEVRKAQRAAERHGRVGKGSLEETLERTRTMEAQPAEKPLTEAIFAAEPNVVSGPSPLGKNYAFFEVTHVKYPKQRPLDEVEETIEEELANEQRRRTLARFIMKWRRKWIAKTNCRPGYVVQKCRQYSGQMASENAYSFS